MSKVTKITIRNVLISDFEESILSLYRNNRCCVFFYQHKAASNTFKSTAILKKKINETRIQGIPFKFIPSTSTDISPMDDCNFGLLKQTSFKRLPKTLERLWEILI